VAEQAGRDVAHHLEESPEFGRCRRLVVYAALPDEVPLAAAIEAARAAGKRLLWPRLPAEGRMVFAHVDRVEDLRPGRYGVPEPPAAAPPESLGPDALVLAPGVAFDREGGRLGRGGGAWDRALADSRGAVTFGVGYEMQVVGRVPREQHDHPMDALVTEVGIRRFTKS
jgi:5-formyltetrahydrofolate cyclo-ligase